ncbi:MAG: CoxG family protein [Alphaproteobacteria bacterium]
MEMTGTSRLKADRETVWEALNNPDVLMACIPGCESFEATGENAFEAVVGAKVGPVKARFKGKVELMDMVPPQSYRLVGEGTGGAAGFAKGSATVTLTEIEGGTELAYEVAANMGGKIAQLGARLMTNTARKYADRFFDAFAEQVGGKLDDEADEDSIGADAAA